MIPVFRAVLFVNKTFPVTLSDDITAGLVEEWSAVTPTQAALLKLASVSRLVSTLTSIMWLLLTFASIEIAIRKGSG